MKTALAWWLALIFMLFQWFQPLLTNVYVIKQSVAQNLVETATNRALLDGYFTQGNLNWLVTTYSQVTGTLPSQISVQATTTPQPRGDAITCTLQAPSGAFYLLGLFGNPHPPIIANAAAMSEALN